MIINMYMVHEGASKKKITSTFMSVAQQNVA